MSVWKQHTTTKSLSHIVATLFLALCAIAPATGQSLAEVARKEAERRGKQPSTSPVYTNKDVIPADAPTPPHVAAPEPAQPKATTESANANKTEGSAVEQVLEGESTAPVTAREKRDEKHWRERASLIRTRLDRVRADTSAIRTRIDALTAAAASASDVEAAALREQSRQASEDLTRFAEELRQYEKEWTTFLQRANEAKIPPEWLR